MSTFGLRHPTVCRAPLRERSPVLRYLQRFDLGEATRWALRGLLIGTIVMLMLDLREVATQRGLLSPLFWPLASRNAVVLPPDGHGELSRSDDPRRKVTTEQSLLDRDMQFTWGSDGRLALTGRIVQGTAEAFAAVLRERAEDVNTVVIDSPGGSLEDAMAMARLIREKGYATDIPDGALCASSCPLLFAGGIARSAGAKASIGLHQFYAAAGSSTDAAAALSSAQTTTARISRFLTEMGVDAALWLHALDTPPQALYYLTTEEGAAYGLVTQPDRMAAVKN